MVRRWLIAFSPISSCCRSSAARGLLCGRVYERFPNWLAFARLLIPASSGQAGHDMKEKPARWCCGINHIGQALELNSLFNQVNQVLDSRSSFHTTRVSPSRSIPRTFVNSGRSTRLPLVFSWKIFVHPAVGRASIWLPLPSCSGIPST